MNEREEFEKWWSRVEKGVSHWDSERKQVILDYCWRSWQAQEREAKVDKEYYDNVIRMWQRQVEKLKERTNI